MGQQRGWLDHHTQGLCCCCCCCVTCSPVASRGQTSQSNPDYLLFPLGLSGSAWVCMLLPLATSFSDNFPHPRFLPGSPLSYEHLCSPNTASDLDMLNLVPCTTRPLLCSFSQCVLCKTPDMRLLSYSALQRLGVPVSTAGKDQEGQRNEGSRSPGARLGMTT